MNTPMRCEHSRVGRGLAPDGGVPVDIVIASKPPPTLIKFGSGERHG